MGARLLGTEEIVRLLAEGPDRIEAAVAGRTVGELAQRPSPDEWSANEILAHLRACQDMRGDVRVIRMLDEDHPIIKSVNPRTWLEQTDYRTLPFRQSLMSFADQRSQFIARIAELSPVQWLRDGTFTGSGKNRQYSVHTEADALARHERSHIRQIEQLRG